MVYVLECVCRNRCAESFFSSFLTVFWTSFSREQAAWPFSSSLWSHPEHFSLGTCPGCAPTCAALHCHIALQPKQARLVLMNLFFHYWSYQSEQKTDAQHATKHALNPRSRILTRNPSIFCGLHIPCSVLICSRVTWEGFLSEVSGVLTLEITSWRVKVVQWHFDS